MQVLSKTHTFAAISFNQQREFCCGWVKRAGVCVCVFVWLNAGCVLRLQVADSIPAQVSGFPECLLYVSISPSLRSLMWSSFSLPLSEQALLSLFWKHRHGNSNPPLPPWSSSILPLFFLSCSFRLPAQPLISRVIKAWTPVLPLSFPSLLTALLFDSLFTWTRRWTLLGNGTEWPPDLAGWDVTRTYRSVTVIKEICGQQFWRLCPHVFVLFVLQLRSSFKQAFSKKKTKSQSAHDEMEEMIDSLPSSPKLQHDNRQGSIATLRSSPSTTEWVIKCAASDKYVCIYTCIHSLPVCSCLKFFSLLFLFCFHKCL